MFAAKTMQHDAGCTVDKKVKGAILYEEKCRRGTHLPSLGREPVGG